jgi:hypothetical protein
MAASCKAALDYERMANSSLITIEKMKILGKEDLASFVPMLEADDIAQLVAWLEEKDDDLRYKSFLLLQGRSKSFSDVYPYWDIFVEKFKNPNSYQRNIGLKLVAENVRWDVSGKFAEIIALYLSLCDDEKPVTVRQCIQGLCSIVPYKKSLLTQITDKLISIDLMQRKETQRKVLLLDILSVLRSIQKVRNDERIDRYIQQAMTSRFLDSRSKKQLETFLQS